MAENYRNYPLEILLEKLKNSAMQLNGYSFEEFSQNFESPEEMVETLNLDAKEMFPVVVELWRRLLPEKASLTVFCNNLEFLIENFYEGESYSEIYETLAELQYFIDETVDSGVSEKEAFSYIQNFVKFDLSNFLFSYILFEIEEGDHSYAEDLCNGFYRYMEPKIWFDYLKVLLEIEKDPEEGFDKLEALIDSSQERDLPFEFEILHFLVRSGNHTLFTKLALKALSHLKVEDDFLELAEICREHFEDLEITNLSDQIDLILQKRGPQPSEKPLSANDQDKFALEKILNQKLQVL